LSQRNPTFLSERARSAAARIAAEHRPYFNLFSRCAVFATDLLFQVHLRKTEPQKVVSALLLARLLESSQAGALLCRVGLERDAAASLRMVFETFVYLVGCCKDPRFLDEYLASELRHKLKVARSNLKRSDLEPEMRKRLEKREPELALEVTRTGAKDLQLEVIAGRFGLGGEYSSVFRLTSSSVHSSPEVLKGLTKLKGGSITGIVYGPSHKYTDIYLFTFSEYLLRAAEHVATLCGEDIEPRSRRLYSQLRRLCPEWPEELE
jgi:hypothetical protein